MAPERIDKEFVLAKVRTMSKVTSKLQLTLPKRLAEQYGIAKNDLDTLVFPDSAAAPALTGLVA